MSKEKYFQVQHVSAGYGEKEIIHDLNFEIEPNTLTALIGPNGCGKTTLLKVLGLIDRPTGGIFYFKGKEVKKLWNDELSDLLKTIGK